MNRISRLTKVFAFAMFLVLASTSMAFAEAPGAGGDGSAKTGIAIGVAALGGALGQGRSVAAALEGIARNPGASGKILVPMILGLALIESLVIYALIIAFSLTGKL